MAIYSISFNININNCDQIKNNQTIYLANTSKSVFEDTNDWIHFSELQQVFT